MERPHSEIIVSLQTVKASIGSLEQAWSVLARSPRQLSRVCKRRCTLSGKRPSHEKTSARQAPSPAPRPFPFLPPCNLRFRPPPPTASISLRNARGLAFTSNRLYAAHICRETHSSRFGENSRANRVEDMTRCSLIPQRRAGPFTRGRLASPRGGIQRGWVWVVTSEWEYLNPAP